MTWPLVYAPRHFWLEPSPLSAGLYGACSVWLACRRRPFQAPTARPFPQTPLYHRFLLQTATPVSFRGFYAARHFLQLHRLGDRLRPLFPWQDDDRFSPEPALLLFLRTQRQVQWFFQFRASCDRLAR